MWGLSCTVEHSYNSPGFSPGAGLGREPHAACSAWGHGPGTSPGPAPCRSPARARSLGAAPAPPAGRRGCCRPGPGPGAAGSGGRGLRQGQPGCGARAPEPALERREAHAQETPSLVAPSPNAFLLPSGIVSPPCQPQPGLRCFLPCFLQTVTWFLVSALF